MSTVSIKSYSELNDLQLLALADFSYSRIDTYNQCPSKYFYSYIIKEPRQFNGPAVLGNIVHAVLENTIENNKEINLEDLTSEYEKNIPLWDPESKLTKDLVETGYNILNEFFDTNGDVQVSIYDKEMSFNFILGSYRILGFIDRVDVFSDRVHITDYKTGKWEVSTKDVPNNLQLGIYALAMHNIFPEKQIYAELYYLRSGRKKGHLFSIEDLNNVKTKLIQSINKIIQDKNFLPTTNVRTCSYCDHAASGVCGTGVFRNRNK